ncbi:PIN domain-containing protein [uncultured Thiohalocapsa sp.]|uniref:PIN domain-containing protein n=1 Tax=uncultured Thiohalocapsa sp. TaxID=768990 RepID=UPI0025FDDB1F|nr:PIN domain-containing protein [uncultured Thiohalocapsa sp.]
MPPTELRCVIDTNVLISAALFADSIPGQVLRHVLRHGSLLASPRTLTESDLARSTSAERRSFPVARLAKRQGRELSLRVEGCRLGGGEQRERRAWIVEDEGAMLESGVSAGPGRG